MWRVLEKSLNRVIIRAMMQVACSGIVPDYGNYSSNNKTGVSWKRVPEYGNYLSYNTSGVSWNRVPE